MRTRMILVLAVLVATLAPLTLAPPAQACMTCYDYIGGGWWYCYRCFSPNFDVDVDNVIPQETQTLVQFVAADRVRVTLGDYATTAVAPDTECLTAFPPLKTVETMTAVTNLDSTNDSPFQDVAFVPSETAGKEAGYLAYRDGLADDDRPWFGFESRITGYVDDGVPNHFTLELKLRPGVSVSAFLADLRDNGIFVTGSTHHGTADGGHLFYRLVSDTEVFVQHPIPFKAKQVPLELF